MVFFALFIISFLTRLLFLYYGYPSITHDEADYFINSYLLAKTGSDIYDQKIFLTSGILNATSSIPIYLGSTIYFFLEKSVIVGRLPYAIANSLIPVLFFLILLKLTKNRFFSAIGFLVLNFSPWFSYLSAMSAIDAPTSLVFYLLGFFILLTKIKPLYKNILFLIFFFLSFNSYMGIKTIFSFLIIITLISRRIYEKEKITARNIIKDITISVSVFLLFFLISWHAPSSEFFKARMSEKIFFLNSSLLTEKVNYLRNLAQGPKIINYVLFNKATTALNVFSEKYLQVFNPHLLFYRGDSHPLYGTYYYGLFYLIDLLFLVVGIFFSRYIFKTNWLVAIPFIMLLIFSPIAIGITIDGATVSLRGYPMIIGYSFFIACGVYYILLTLVKNKKLILPISIFIYLFSFFHFFLTYRTIIRYASSDQWHINEKILMDKIEEIKNKSDKKIYIYVNGPRETMLLYLFYKVNNPKDIKKNLSENRLNYGNIYFSAECPQQKLDDSIQIMHSERCPIDKKMFTTRPLFSPETFLSSRYLLLE